MPSKSQFYVLGQTEGSQPVSPTLLRPTWWLRLGGYDHGNGYDHGCCGQLGDCGLVATTTATATTTVAAAELGDCGLVATRLRPRLLRLNLMVAAWWLRRQRRLDGKPRFRFLRFRFLRFLIKPQAVRFLRFRFGFHGSGSVCGFPDISWSMH